MITFYLDADKFDAFRGLLRAWLLTNRQQVRMYVFPTDHVIRVTGCGCSRSTIDDLVQDEIVDPKTMVYTIKEQ